MAEQPGPAQPAHAGLDPDAIDEQLELLWTGRATVFDELIADCQPGAELLDALRGSLPDSVAMDVRQPPDIEGLAGLKFLGRGGMGEVFEARESATNQRVAVKLIRFGRNLSERRRELFEREIRALARISHPGIASIHRAGIASDGRRFLVMELVEGANLLDFAFALGPCRGRLRPTFRQRLRMFCQVCQAVEYAHGRGVIHSDLKPANILVAENGSAKIIDFGLACSSAIRDENGAAPPGGTLRYSSPEQMNHGQVGPASDIYSLGVILFELVTGHSPYKVSNFLPDEARKAICETPPPRPSSIESSLPFGLDCMILKALEKQPGKRYASVAAMLEELKRGVLASPRDQDEFGVLLKKLKRD